MGEGKGKLGTNRGKGKGEPDTYKGEGKGEHDTNKGERERGTQINHNTKHWTVPT